LAKRRVWQLGFPGCDESTGSDSPPRSGGSTSPAQSKIDLVGLHHRRSGGRPQLLHQNHPTIDCPASFDLLQSASQEAHSARANRAVPQGHLRRSPNPDLAMKRANFPLPKLCFGEMSVVIIQILLSLESSSESKIILIFVIQKTLGLFSSQSVVFKLSLKPLKSQFDFLPLFSLNIQSLYSGNGVG
jgi:hypothetical protein